MMSHEETLHVSTTACMEQNISTQASMICVNSVQETETPNTQVENHQTDPSAGPASSILSTMSSMKLRDIMDKMTSCLFGWSWRQVSLFNLTGKDTATVKPTGHIPCTAIVPVRVQELFVPCSSLEDTVSCNKEVDESVAVPPQPSLAELELRIHLTQICDITARLCVVFRPECIVEVDCSILNFEAIADGMRRIGLPQPTRSTAVTLAIMPHQTSAVQLADTSGDQPDECDDHKIALDASLLEDTTSYNQVEVVEFVANPPQSRVAHLELRLQFQGICDITARLYVDFRPDGIVEVEVSILRFVAIADDIREIDFQLPIESILSSPEFMSLQQVALMSEVQPFYYDNFEMALDVTRQQTQQLEVHEFQAADRLNPDTATDNTATTLDHHDVMANQLEESLKVPQYVACDNHEIPIEIPRWSQAAEGVYHDAIATNPIADDKEDMVTETSNLPEETLEARVVDNEQKAVKSMLNEPQPSPAELELCLQLPGICDITARVYVVFRPEGIADVYVSILNFVAIADDIREIDFQLPLESILNSPEFMSLQQVAVTSKVQPVDCVNYEMALDVTRQQNQQLYDHEFQAVDCLYPDTATDNTATTLYHHDVMANQLQESLKMPQYAAGHNHELTIEAPRWSQAAEGVYHDAIATNPILDGQELMVTETSNLPEDILKARVADNEQKAVESMTSVPQPSPAELELCLQLPGICDITARVYVVFRPEGIADVYVSILNFDAIADDIREIDFQLPIESILNSPEFMSLQQVAVTSKVQPVDCVNYQMALDVTRQQNQQLYDHEFQAVDCLNPDTATYNTATTLDHHDVMAIQLEESLKVPQYVAGDNHEIPIESPRWSQIAEDVYHDAIAKNPILDHQEVMVNETSNLPEDTLEAKVAENEQKLAMESMLNVPQNCPAELELCLQLPGICDITARVYVVFRPEGIADVYVSILNFVAIADDIREIDFQLPLESILSSPEFMSLQQVAVTSKVQPFDCVKYEMALETPQGEDHDQHLFVPAQTTVNEPDTIKNERICSRLAFTSSHDVIQPTSEAVVSKDLKGSEIFHGNAVQSEGENPVADRVVISGKDVPTISDDHSSTRNSTTSEDLDELCPRFASIDTSLLVSESTSCKTNADSDSGLEAFFGKTIKSEDNNCGAETADSEKVLPTPAETVRESVEVAPIESSDEYKLLVDVNAQLTNNALAELVTRGIKEIRKSVDATAREIEYVPLEGSKENRRSRKRSHGDESNHQLLGKDTGRKAPSTPLLEDAVEDTRDSQLVTHRYPSDVHHALLTQTVDLLERGIVLISDDGSFKAFVNPSSASRIGWALTGNNFSRTFKRYNNDVLPQDLKQKVVERAALVARQHQDRAFEGLAERPIFTLSEIRHYDCNGDYIMEDVSSPNTPVYPFTGIQPTSLHQCFVNPFQSGIAPQGLLTFGMHNPFHTMQQYQYTVNNIEMIDVDELYMDIDESFEDVFMECEDQTDCPYCSQISLNLFAPLPTKYAISRRAIYSLLDERPLNPEIPSLRVKQGSKKSWFEYNTFSFRPEFDEPSGVLSRKDRVIYSVLDERPLNPVLSPSLTRQSNMNSWFSYNTFSFKEGDLVPIGSKCDCIKRTQNPFQAASQAAHTVPSTAEPWPKLGQNTTASKSPFNTFSFSFADRNSQQESIFGESKQESVFSIEKAEQPVPSTQPVKASSVVSCKGFSFREEDDPKHVALFGESKKSLTPSLIQAEEDESYDTKQQLTDLSLEPAEQALNKKTLTFVFGEEEQPAFPVSDDSDSTSSETESHDEDLFDLNDENEEIVIEEIIEAVKLKLKESNASLDEREAPSNTSVESESVKDTNKTPIKVESVIKQDAVDGQKVDLKTTSEAKDKVDNTLINGKGQSQVANHISQDAPQTLTAEKECKNIAEPPSKLTISHPKSISKRTEPYPTQAGTGLAAFLRRRVKVIEHDRLKSLQVSTQVSQVEKDEDSSNPVPALPVNVQQRRIVSLKSLTGNTKTHPSSKHDLSITIASSDEDDRKVVSSKSLTGNTEIHSSTKHDLSITIAPSDEEDHKVVSSKTHDKKPDSPPSSSVAVTPVVQSHVKSSKKKVSLKSLHQTKKEPDVKGSEMERLMSRAERKNSDAFSKSTPSHSKSHVAGTANNIKRVSIAQSDRTERETVSSVAEKRGKVISLRSVIQSKKAEPTSKSSSPQGETIQGSGQICKRVPEKGRSQLASLKSSSLMPKEDSISNSIPHLPLDAENNEVISMNPLSEGGNTETSSKSNHSVASAPSGVQKTNVLSLKSLTRATCKKDELVKNAAVATVPQVSSGMTYSKESSSVIENKVMLKPKMQCKSMDSLKGPVASAPPVSITKVDNSAKKDLVKSLDQTKKVDLVKDNKSEPLINKTAVSSPQVSTVVESSAKKITFKKTDVKGNDASKKSSTSKVQISCEKKAKVVAMETASQDCVVETGSARKVAFKSTHERRKEDEFTKSSVSTATLSLEKNAEMVSFKEESHASSVAESSCARAVPFKSKLQKKDALNMSSAEPVSELMSFKSVMASEKAVPVDTTRVPSNVASFSEALTAYNAADVKSNGSANGRADQHPVSESSNSVKPKSFQSRTSLHKRELEEMLEEDQLSDMERLRKFNSRNGKPSSEKPRKANVKPKSVGNSCDVDNNKNSEANVKLFKTAAVQDTSIAKRSSETTKQLKPISLAVDVNIVKDAKNECNAKWIPGTLEKIKPSPEGRVAVADVPKSTSSIELGKETSHESNLTPLATVKTGDVSVTSAVQSSPATPNPNPLPPAEVKTANKGDTNAVQSSRSITSTKIEPSTPARNDTETVNSSEKSGLPKPEENLSSMDLVKEPLCLAGALAIFGENVINIERIYEPPLASVPQPAAENVTLGKRKLEAMQDEEIPTVETEKPVEVKKKRRWGPAEKTPENLEQQNKPRRIVRNKFKKA